MNTVLINHYLLKLICCCNILTEHSLRVWKYFLAKRNSYMASMHSLHCRQHLHFVPQWAPHPLVSIPSCLCLRVPEDDSDTRTSQQYSDRENPYAGERWGMQASGHHNKVH